jgi:hypothetical protein
LDQAAVGHYRDVKADLIGMWGNLVSCHSHNMARHQPLYIIQLSPDVALASAVRRQIRQSAYQAGSGRGGA